MGGSNRKPITREDLKVSTRNEYLNKETTNKDTKHYATFGGGCFWCTEACLQRVSGVTKVTSGYAGGHDENPSYKAVCRETTGHAEVVQVEYLPSVVTYTTILKAFFTSHDPTQLNRQGADRGTQYRSIILYHDEGQKKDAESLIGYLNDKVFGGRIKTELVPFEVFYPAEGYHQDYYRNNPYQGYCMAVVGPKLKKFLKAFKSDMWNDAN